MRQFTDTDRIAVKVGEPFVVVLAENGPGGYLWRVADLPSAIRVRREDDLPPGVGAPGATGETVFELEAKDFGTSTLRFERRRDWSPARTVSGPWSYTSPARTASRPISRSCDLSRRAAAVSVLARSDRAGGGCRDSRDSAANRDSATWARSAVRTRGIAAAELAAPHSN